MSCGIKNYQEHKCIGCGAPGLHSILLAVGEDREGETRFYLPNQSFRKHATSKPELHRNLGESQEEKWFCQECMRTIEDNIRATIQYLQTESGIAKCVKK